MADDEPKEEGTNSWGADDDEEDESGMDAFMYQRKKPGSSLSDKIGRVDLSADIDPDGGESMFLFFFLFLSLFVDSDIELMWEMLLGDAITFSIRNTTGRKCHPLACAEAPTAYPPTMYIFIWQKKQNVRACFSH